MISHQKQAAGATLRTALKDVVITSHLQTRPVREFDLQREMNTFRELADYLAKDPATFLDRLVELALILCDADTVGISVEESDEKGARIFRWVAMAGQLKHLVGGTTPRNFSPCGVCVDENRPLLMNRLDRFYPYFKEAPLPFIEALLIPWEVKDGPVGTLWIVAHTDRRKFDQQDVWLMGYLAVFASVAMRLRENVLESERAVAASQIVNAMAHQINNPLQAAMLALSHAASQDNLSDMHIMVSIAEKELQRVAALSAQLIQKAV